MKIKAKEAIVSFILHSETTITQTFQPKAYIYYHKKFWTKEKVYQGTPYVTEGMRFAIHFLKEIDANKLIQINENLFIKFEDVKEFWIEEGDEIEIDVEEELDWW